MRNATGTSSVDRLFEESARSLAGRTSRRSLLAALGQLLTGAALLPLLPLARGNRAQAAAAKPAADNPESCDYWRYCAIDGFLCACCGGTATSCPPGTAPSPITWIGTCHNPGDGRHYMVSQRLLRQDQLRALRLHRNEREKPTYRPRATMISTGAWRTPTRTITARYRILGVVPRGPDSVRRGRASPRQRRPRAARWQPRPANRPSSTRSTARAVTGRRRRACPARFQRWPARWRSSCVRPRDAATCCACLAPPTRR